MPQTQAIQDFLSPPSVEIHLGTVVLNLVIAAGLAFVLGRVYVRYGTALSNRRQFAGNFLLLACTTTLVITVVKSSLALSLGLVGALSIVRFRAAIKEPEELAYLFLLIAIGLGLGADQRMITAAAFAVICGLIWLRNLWRGSREETNLFLTVTSSETQESQLARIVEVLRSHCSEVSLRRFDEGAQMLEVCFQVQFESFEALQAGKRALREFDGGMQISLVDNRGVL